MLRIHYLFLLALAIFSSCSKENVEHDSEYNDSYRSMLDFKASSGNSYRYMVAFGSWTGFGNETVITVMGGKVVQRAYVSKKHANDGTGQVTILSEWTEDANQLGSHTEGAELLTMDDIYKRARTDWLLKRENADTYLETGNNGMISSCGYVDKNCADDCFRGISISYIRAI